MDYHRDELRMKQIPIDPCFWYRKESQTLTGVLALQVDDTLYGGDPKFLALEVKKSEAFPNSGRSEINSKPTRFNGIDLSTKNACIIMDQRYYVEKFNVTGFRNMEFKEFRSIRQKVAYAA